MSQQDPDLQQGAPPAAPAPAAEAPVAQPAVAERVIDPAYVAQLEQFARDQQAQLNRLAPISDEVNWMLEDEARLEGIKRYRKSYEDASKPQYDPTVEPVVEYIKNELAPVKAYITREEANRQRAEQTQKQQFERENMQFAARIQAEHKLSHEQLVKVAAYADSAAARLGRNVGIEEAWKDMTAFGGPKTEAAKAPVLRADEGAVGVPGPSKSDTNRWVTDFHGALTDALIAEKRTA